MMGEGLVCMVRPDASNLCIVRARMDQTGGTVKAEDKGPEGIMWRHSTAHSLILKMGQKKCHCEDKNRGLFTELSGVGKKRRKWVRRLPAIRVTRPYLPHLPPNVPDDNRGPEVLQGRP